MKRGLILGGNFLQLSANTQGERIRLLCDMR